MVELLVKSFMEKTISLIMLLLFVRLSWGAICWFTRPFRKIFFIRVALDSIKMANGMAIRHIAHMVQKGIVEYQNSKKSANEKQSGEQPKETEPQKENVSKSTTPKTTTRKRKTTTNKSKVVNINDYKKKEVN